MAVLNKGTLALSGGDGRCIVTADGVWDITTVQSLDDSVRAISPPSGSKVRIDLAGIEKLDTAGAWVLFRLRQRLIRRGLRRRV